MPSGTGGARWWRIDAGARGRGKVKRQKGKGRFQGVFEIENLNRDVGDR